jgi:serine/threonine protein kinase
MTPSESIDFSLSKEDGFESLSLSRASLDDARDWLTDERTSITTERIVCGTPLLDTYMVTSDAMHGGMGSVWRVHHSGWDVDIAMKRPQPRFFAEAGPKRRKEFIEECERWIDLGLHPHIVSCYYVREVGGVPTVFSEWMDGGSLRDAMRSGRLYEGKDLEVQARILDIAIQAARGLAFAQGRGLLHQDMKPGNLLLTQMWDAKIADFGLAKAVTGLGEGSQAVRSTGYTPEYCPREQAEGATAEPWMDVFAWAITVLEMYRGNRPWKTGAEVAERLSTYLAGCRVTPHPLVRRLLARCLLTHRETFVSIERELLRIYDMVIGYEYPRDAPEPGADTAGSLNNRALSFLDLGKPEEAERLWNRAVLLDEEAEDARVNRILYQWRTGRFGDDVIMDSVRDLSSFADCEAVEAQFTLERGSTRRALGDFETVHADASLPGPFQICHAHVCDGIISLVLRVEHDDDRRLYLRRYDARTGERVDAWRGDDAIVSNSYMVDLNNDATRMLVHSHGLELWDTDRRCLVAAYPDGYDVRTYWGSSLYDEVDVGLFSMVEPYLSPPDKFRKKPFRTERTILNRWSDGRSETTLAEHSEAYLLENGLAMVMGNGLEFGVRRVSDLSLVHALPKPAYKEKYGTFRGQSGSCYCWIGDPSRKLTFYREQGERIVSAQLERPWMASRLRNHDHDLFASIDDDALYVREIATGRVLQTFFFVPPEEREPYYSPDAQPNLRADYQARCAVVYPCSDRERPLTSLSWQLITLPDLITDTVPMSYRVSVPMSSHEASKAAHEQEERWKRFCSAEHDDDIQVMLACYDEMRDAPALAGEDVSARMNEILMRHCDPVGIRGIRQLDKEERISTPWAARIRNEGLHGALACVTDDGAHLLYLTPAAPGEEWSKVKPTSFMIDSYDTTSQLISSREIGIEDQGSWVSEIKAVSRDGSAVVLSLAGGGTSEVWMDLKTGEYRSLDANYSYVREFHLSPDGRTVFSHMSRWMSGGQIIEDRIDTDEHIVHVLPWDLFGRVRDVERIQLSDDGTRLYVDASGPGETDDGTSAVCLGIFDLRSHAWHTFYRASRWMFIGATVSDDLAYALICRSGNSILVSTKDGSCLWELPESLMEWRGWSTFSLNHCYLMTSASNGYERAWAVYWEYAERSEPKSEPESAELGQEPAGQLQKPKTEEHREHSYDRTLTPSMRFVMFRAQIEAELTHCAEPSVEHVLSGCLRLSEVDLDVLLSIELSEPDATDALREADELRKYLIEEGIFPRMLRRAVHNVLRNDGPSEPGSVQECFEKAREQAERSRGTSAFEAQDVLNVILDQQPGGIPAVLDLYGECLLGDV